MSRCRSGVDERDRRLPERPDRRVHAFGELCREDERGGREAPPPLGEEARQHLRDARRLSRTVAGPAGNRCEVRQTRPAPERRVEARHHVGQGVALRLGRADDRVPLPGGRDVGEEEDAPRGLRVDPRAEQRRERDVEPRRDLSVEALLPSRILCRAPLGDERRGNALPVERDARRRSVESVSHADDLRGDPPHARRRQRLGPRGGPPRARRPRARRGSEGTSRGHATRPRTRRRTATAPPGRERHERPNSESARPTPIPTATAGGRSTNSRPGPPSRAGGRSGVDSLHRGPPSMLTSYRPPATRRPSVWATWAQGTLGSIRSAMRRSQQRGPASAHRVGAATACSRAPRPRPHTARRPGSARTMDPPPTSSVGPSAIDQASARRGRGGRWAVGQVGVDPCLAPLGRVGGGDREGDSTEREHGIAEEVEDVAHVGPRQLVRRPQEDLGAEIGRGWAAEEARDRVAKGVERLRDGTPRRAASVRP